MDVGIFGKLVIFSQTYKTILRWQNVNDRLGLGLGLGLACTWRSKSQRVDRTKILRKLLFYSFMVYGTLVISPMLWMVSFGDTLSVVLWRKGELVVREAIKSHGRHLKSNIIGQGFHHCNWRGSLSR